MKIPGCWLVAVALCAFCVTGVHAQAEADSTATDETLSGEHETPFWFADVFVGLTTELEYGDLDGTYITLGFEVGYRPWQRFGLLAITEIVLSRQSVREAVLIALGAWHPYRELRLVLGPGVQLDNTELVVTREAWLARIGADWEFTTKAGVFIAPGFYVDIIETRKFAFVYGVSLAKRF